MKVNQDPETSVHYGVISINEVHNFDAIDEILKTVYLPYCPECYEELENDDITVCPSCECSFNEPLYGEEPDAILLSGYGIEGVLHEGILMIFKSPVITQCGFCSPCYPNAGSLTSEGNVTTYCLPLEFFEEGRSPYKNIWKPALNKENSYD